LVRTRGEILDQVSDLIELFGFHDGNPDK